MSSLAQALGYLSEVTKFASQGPVSYGMGECVCIVRPYTVMAGMLSKSDTDKLVDDYCNVRGGQLDGYGRVPVVMSLRTLVYEDPRRPAKGLLLVPAMLDINGRLSVDVGTQRPWIPLERLSAPGSAPRAVTVASLADYRHFQLEHQAEFDDPVTWGVYVDLAASMFDAIFHVDQSGLDDSNCRVDSELCRIKCMPLKEPTLTASNVFTYLASHPDAGLPPTLAPYFGDHAEFDDDSAPTLTISRTELKQAEEEREARATQAKDTGTAPRGEALGTASPALPAAHDDEALGTPTDPTSLRAIDRLMENAKRRRGSCLATQRLSGEAYDVLRLLWANDPGPLSCIRVPLGDEALDLAAALVAARVTDCAVQGEEEPYLLAGVSSGVFRRRATVAFDAAFGVASDAAASGSPLWGPWFNRSASRRERPRETEHFLQRVGAYVGHTPATTEAAARVLATRLRRIDQLRCELIDGYTEVRTASDLARQQEERLLALARLRDEHVRAKRRLDYWTDLAEQGRAHRALGRGRGGQREALKEGALEGETFALESKTLDEVVQKYQELVAKQEEKLASTRRETAKLELRVRRHSLSGTKGAEDVAVLVDLCKLNRTGKRELDSLFAGGELTAQKLDRVLDRTVRPCEFWLAVHLYEARELQRTAVRTVPRWRTVATIYEIPGLVGRFAGTPPIDTLICLRAERMRTPQALSCLALSRRALVMGDPTGIGPRWELDGRADSDVAHLTMHTDGWEFVRTHELGASAPQRFFSATEIACNNTPRTLYQLHGLSPSRGAIARFRSDAFYGGSGADELEPGVTALHLFAEGPSEPERVGNSVRNQHEAAHLVEWVLAEARHVLKHHAKEERPICVLTPYTSQAQLIRDLLNKADMGVSRRVDVRVVRQASGEGVPVVVFSGVVSVETLNADFAFGADSLLSVCAAIATRTLAVFCDASWKREGARHSRAVKTLVQNASPWTEPKEPVLPVAAQEAAAPEGEAAQVPQNAHDEVPAGSAAAPTDEAPSETHTDDEGTGPAAPTETAAELADIVEHEASGVLDQDAASQREASSGAAALKGASPDETVPEDSAGNGDGESSDVEPSAADETKGSAETPDSQGGNAETAVSNSAPAPQPKAAVPAPQPEETHPKVYATLEQVLHELFVAGALPAQPETDMCFRWLQRDGYVRVSSARDGSIGWVPTQRGVRCGIYPQQADDGSLWCGFSDGSAEYVLASVQLHSKNR